MGELGYVEQFFAIRPIDDITVRYFEAHTRPGTPTPRSVLSIASSTSVSMPPWSWWMSALRFSINPVICRRRCWRSAELPKIFETDDATVRLQGTFVYQKELYQWLFGRQYLTADLVAQEVGSCSFKVMPFTILGIEPQGATTKIHLGALCQ